MQHVQTRPIKMNLLGLIEIALTLQFDNQQFANLYEHFLKSYCTEGWVWSSLAELEIYCTNEAQEQR